MTMQKRLRGMVLAVGMCFAAYAAYAENITVSTYYPSPYGNYVTLDSTGQTHLAAGAAAGTGVAIGYPVGTNVGAGLRLDLSGGTRVAGSITVTGASAVTGASTTGSLILTGSPGGSGTLQASCSGGACYAVYAP